MTSPPWSADGAVRHPAGVRDLPGEDAQIYPASSVCLPPYVLSRQPHLSGRARKHGQKTRIDNRRCGACRPDAPGAHASRRGGAHRRGDGGVRSSRARRHAAQRADTDQAVPRAERLVGRAAGPVASRAPARAARRRRRPRLPPSGRRSAGCCAACVSSTPLTSSCSGSSPRRCCGAEPPPRRPVSSRSNSSGFTGLTRWWSKPAWSARCRPSGRHCR